MLIGGIIEWFNRSGSPFVNHVPRWRQGVATKLEQQTLNGYGIVLVVCQGVITLLIAALLSEPLKFQYGLFLVIAWFAASLVFGVLFAYLGTRSATIVYRYDEIE